MRTKGVPLHISWILLLLVALVACQPMAAIPGGADPWYVAHLAITHDSVELCNEARYGVKQCKDSVTTKQNHLNGLILPSVKYPPVEYMAFDIKQQAGSCTRIAYAAFDDVSIVAFPELYVTLCSSPASSYTCWREEGPTTPRGRIVRTHCCADDNCTSNLTVSTTDTGVIGWSLLNTTLRTLSDQWIVVLE